MMIKIHLLLKEIRHHYSNYKKSFNVTYFIGPILINVIKRLLTYKIVIDLEIRHPTVW
jgi:hypothetical protein